MQAEADRISPPQPFVYLVLLRQALVAEDISMTIADFEPGARVVRAIHPEAVAPGQHFDVAFIGISPTNDENSVMAQTLAAQGTQVVLIGDDPLPVTVPAKGWSLPLPFTTDTVVALLTRARRLPGV